MCDMCDPKTGEQSGCQDCGTPICFDDGTAYVTAFGDVFCVACGRAIDKAEEAEWDDAWDFYPSSWYDPDSAISDLEPEDTPRMTYIGPDDSEAADDAQD